MGPPHTQLLEREVKFEAPPGLSLPDLRGLVRRTERLPQEHLHTAYFDTTDRRLWDRGITLRHRRKGDDAIGTWELKVPVADDDVLAQRNELSWPGDDTNVPEGALRLLSGIIRREHLHRQVEMETTRQRLALHGEDDGVVAELDDDAVVVGGGPCDGMRFRQVELELYEGGDTIEPKVTQMMADAGAQPGGPSKFALATGLASGGRRGVAVDEKSSMHDVVRAALTDGYEKLVDHDWRLRVAQPDVDAHDVHQARVATRRLRAHLKTFRKGLDPVWVDHVREDLRWLGSLLGDVRDLDVLAESLGDTEPEVTGQIVRARAEAVRPLLDAVHSDRYLDLLGRLHAAAAAPPFLAMDGRHGPSARAVTVLPALVAKRWRSLRRQVVGAGSDPSDHQLHRIRIKAKQLRYAAETAIPVCGKPAARTAKAAEELQTVLGEHHDAVRAEEWLREHVNGSASTTLSPAGAFEAGRLSAREQRRQRALRGRWSHTWKTLAKKKRRRWMR